jgi:hypothetical protein
MPKTPMPSPSRKSENGLAAIYDKIKTIKPQQFAASIPMQIQTKAITGYCTSTKNRFKIV